MKRESRMIRHHRSRGLRKSRSISRIASQFYARRCPASGKFNLLNPEKMLNVGFFLPRRVLFHKTLEFMAENTICSGPGNGSFRLCRRVIKILHGIRVRLPPSRRFPCCYFIGGSLRFRPEFHVSEHDTRRLASLTSLRMAF
jgi:hypothetical protein